MSADLPQIECRLCGTLYPESTRFCPNCREPNPEVHEDLLMAARLTGVSYEILLERAWASEGLVPGRRRAAALEAMQPEPEPARRGWAPGSVVERVRRQRDFAVVGCVVVLALVTLGLVAVLLVTLLDSEDGDDENGSGIVITVPDTEENAAPTQADTSPASPTASGGGTGGGTPAAPTAALIPLVLEAGQAATYSDGYRASLLSYDNQVSALAPTNTPRAGSRFVAVEVRACAGDRPAATGPDDWRIEMPDGAQFEPVELPVQPVLSGAQLAAGACAEGWVAFEIPAEPAPAYIVHRNPAYADVRFIWPG